MSINMELETVEQLWEYEKELIQTKSKEFAKRLALPDAQVTSLQRIVSEIRYEAMRDALYTGREKGYSEGRKEGREALVIILHELLEKHSGAITVDVSRLIAVARISELSSWIRQLLAGDEPRTVFC